MQGIEKFTRDVDVSRVVVDLDTGVVLGTNLRILAVTDVKLEELMSSADTAREYGKKYGKRIIPAE